jgi:hypothetical protein
MLSITALSSFRLIARGMWIFISPFSIRIAGIYGYGSPCCGFIATKPWAVSLPLAQFFVSGKVADGGINLGY